MDMDARNKLRFKGVLADGTIANQATMISRSGRWPLFASLYRGKGVLLGWLSFTNEPDSDLRGTNVSWTKMPGAVGRLYTNGFALTGAVVGSEYAPSPFNANWTSSSLEIASGNLTVGLTNPATIGSDNKLAITSIDKTTMAVRSLSGLLKGRFINPATGKNTALKGALLQKQELGAGFFPGTSESGSFLLHPDVE
jgi:hypothetical protein